MMKKTILLNLAVCLILATPSVSQAKFSGSIGGSNSYISSSSHSYSYSKPPSSSSMAYSKPPSSSSMAYSKPSSSSSSVSTGSSVKTSKSLFNRSGSFAVSSSTYKKMNSYSSSYSKPPLTVNKNSYSTPVYNHMYSTYGSVDGYYSARQRDIGGWYNRYPEPSYVYHMHPNYGVYDSYFMWLILANAMQPSYSNWAYSHQNDPSYQSWYSDEQAQAQNNTQVAQQLATLNAQVAALKAKNAPIQADDVLPTGVTPDIAISPSAVAQNSQPDNAAVVFVKILEVLAFLFVGFVLFIIIRERYFSNKTSITW
jgi:hypothetical protein